MDERNTARRRPIHALQHRKQRETIKRLFSRMQIKQRRPQHEILQFHVNKWRMFIVIQFFLWSQVSRCSEFRQLPQRLWRRIYKLQTVERRQNQKGRRIIGGRPPAVGPASEPKRHGRGFSTGSRRSSPTAHSRLRWTRCQQRQPLTN